MASKLSVRKPASPTMTTKRRPSAPLSTIWSLYSRELDELSHDYATTIHKSQGSEYPIVVIPVHFTNYVMLQRNLIYTAVTRAKKICIVIGQRRALWYAVSHVTVTQRNTKLKERLQGKTIPMTYTHHDEETQTDMAAENKFE